MPTQYSLPWRAYGSGYVASLTHTIAAAALTVYLRGSVGKDAIRVNNIEVDARLTTSPFVLSIDGVQQTIPTGGYSSYNVSGVTDRIVLSGGNAGDVLTLNFYNLPRIEWR